MNAHDKVNICRFLEVHLLYERHSLLIDVVERLKLMMLTVSTV